MGGTGSLYNRFRPSDGISRRAGGTQCGVDLPRPPERAARRRVKSPSWHAAGGCIVIFAFRPASSDANRAGRFVCLKDFRYASRVTRSLQRTPNASSKHWGDGHVRPTHNAFVRLRPTVMNVVPYLANFAAAPVRFESYLSAVFS